eukprot:3579406-Prymnesium_polylepis.2
MQLQKLACGASMRCTASRGLSALGRVASAQPVKSGQRRRCRSDVQHAQSTSSGMSASEPSLEVEVAGAGERYAIEAAARCERAAQGRTRA